MGERVVAIMHGKVVNRKRLREFAAFSLNSQNLPVTDYQDLKRQLRRAAADIEDAEKKFVEFPNKPLPDGTLITDQAGRLGRINKCNNPSDRSDWKYDVAFGKGKDPKVEPGLSGDDLDSRMDLGWIANPAVLAVIPDGLE